jgi:hypothetical protein
MRRPAGHRHETRGGWPPDPRMMIRRGQHLWELSFAFRRALLSPALLAWASDDANADAVWKQLAKRADERPGTFRPLDERSVNTTSERCHGLPCDHFRDDLVTYQLHCVQIVVDEVLQVHTLNPGGRVLPQPI